MLVLGCQALPPCTHELDDLVFNMVWVFANIPPSVGTHAQVIDLLPNGVDDCLASHIGRASLGMTIEVIDHLPCNVPKITLAKRGLAVNRDELLLGPLESSLRFVSLVPL